MKIKLKQISGITLIALVITIIILLILVGVSIAMLTGDNGILTKATQAKNENAYATEEEKMKLCIMASYGSEGTLSLDELKTQVTNEGGSVAGEKFPVTVTMDGNDFTIDSSGKYLDKKEIGDITGNEDKNVLTYDSLENQIIVPAGFKVVNPTDTVCDGIVVEDVSHTATAGSQFVWIPVGEVKRADGSTVNIKLSRYTFDENGQETAQEENVINNYYQELATSNYENTTAKDLEGFKTKTISSGGYYIGRYEARTATQRTAKTDDSGLTQITCKADDYVYNYVMQPQAAELSRNMYNDGNFESDLINSYAWDTVVVYLQTFGNDSNYSNKMSVNEFLATQGTNKLETQDVMCNIYDIASNTFEWTTETCNISNTSSSVRGDGYGNIYNYTKSRNNRNVNTVADYRAFRSLLYL